MSTECNHHLFPRTIKLENYTRELESPGMAFQLPTNLNANATACQPKGKLPKLILTKFRGDIMQ